MPLIILNKPFRVLSQFTDTDGRATLADYVDAAAVYPAGRLDYDSEGLMLLTDDGRLQSAIAEPARKLDKHYWVQVEGAPRAAELGALVRGVTSRGQTLKADSATIITPPDVWVRQPPIRERKSVPSTWLTIVLSAGKNRQIRRMTAAVGYPTLRVIRHQIGPFRLRGLMPGTSTVLTNEFAHAQLRKHRRR